MTENTDEAKIPFRTLLKPGETSFVVSIPRKFVDRKFGFESITLMPEYQNIQAYNYNLDSKMELESEIRHPIQLEVTYGPQYAKEERKVWSYLSSQTTLGAILSSVNLHFERQKPAGVHYPLFFIDWIHFEALDDDQTIRGYQRENAQALYGEEFADDKHDIGLPVSLKEFTEYNDCIFPKTNTEEFLSNINIRLWVAPNTTVTFSNYNLLKALGFNTQQLPGRTKRGQVPLVNESVDEYRMFNAMESPVFGALPVADLRGTKINTYVTKKSILSPMGALVTQKQREKDPTQFGADFASALRDLGKKVNIMIDLKYSAVTRTFSVEYPNNPNIEARMYIPASLISQLGFEATYGDCLDQRMTAKPLEIEVDAENLEKKSLALVYDTGMVAVDLSQQKSHLSSHSGNVLMTTLHPLNDGTLCNRIFFKDVVRIQVTSTNPDLRFLLYRFDDHGIKCPLAWPIGAYVFGTLTGKV